VSIFSPPIAALERWRVAALPPFTPILWQNKNIKKENYFNIKKCIFSHEKK
jgi:hypothetical protein